MKKNEFNLESVLEMRRRQEDDARQELSCALARQVEALNHSVEAARVLNRIMQQFAKGGTGRFSAADREREWGIQQMQQTRCTELEAALRECERETEAKRALVINAHRNCELLERLKKLRQEEAEREQGRAEQCLFDELAMTQHHSASGGAFVLW